MSDEQHKTLDAAVERVRSVIPSLLRAPQPTGVSRGEVTNAAMLAADLQLVVSEIDALRAKLAAAEREREAMRKTRMEECEFVRAEARAAIAAAEQERDRAREAIREALEYRAHLPIHVRLILDANLKGEP